MSTFPEINQVVTITFGWAKGQTGKCVGYGHSPDSGVICLIQTDSPGKSVSFMPQQTIIALSTAALSFGKEAMKLKVMEASAKIKAAKAEKVTVGTYPRCDHCGQTVAWCTGCGTWEKGENASCDSYRSPDSHHWVLGEKSKQVWDEAKANSSDVPTCGTCLQEVKWCVDDLCWESATPFHDEFCGKDTNQQHKVMGYYDKYGWDNGQE